MASILLTGCEDKSVGPDSVMRIFFTTGNARIAVDEKTDLTLKIENLPESIFGMSLRLSYDKTIISFTDSTGIENGGLFGPDAIIFIRNNDSTIYTTFTQIKGQDKVNGSGDVCILSFKGEAPGNSEIRVLENELILYDFDGTLIEITEKEIQSALIEVK